MRTWIAIACTVSLGASIVDARSSESTEMLDRFLNSGKPALTSYKARRVLTASSMGGRMSATLEAWTLLNTDGTFSFEVIRQEGSGLIQEPRASRSARDRRAQPKPGRPGSVRSHACEL